MTLLWMNTIRMASEDQTSNRAVSTAIAFFLIAFLTSGPITPAYAQQSFIGDLSLVPYNFTPRYWASCDGQLLSISQNTALFSILGTTYGGNGVTNFALPNLNSRTPVGQGQGPGLSQYFLGQTGGEATHTLLISEMPSHSHVLAVNNAVGTSDDPTGGYYAGSASGVPLYAPINSVLFNASVLGSQGGNQPHNNWQPYLGLKWIICLQGVFPPRS